MYESTKVCNSCEQEEPISSFERCKGGHRSTCNRCRKRAKKARPRAAACAAPPAAPAPAPEPKVPENPVAIINAFALWFGPVDRSRPLAWAP